MKSFKPSMQGDSVHAVIRDIMGERPTDVSPIHEGELSQVFRFTHVGQHLVIHFQNSTEQPKANPVLMKALSHHGIAIPQTILVGQLEGMQYTVSEQIVGQSLATLDDETVRSVLPSVLTQFRTMMDIKIEGSTGYGWLLPNGHGSYSTWSQFLVAFFDENQDGFWKDWYTLFEGDILERDVYDTGYQTMMELSDFAPRTRYLVHGDFHLGNILSDGRAVTGIVDWDMALYGDFMFDVATMHFWRPDLNFPEKVRERWNAEGKPLPCFDERLKCGLLFKGLDGLRFFAKKADPDGYAFVKHRLETL